MHNPLTPLSPKHLVPTTLSLTWKHLLLPPAVFAAVIAAVRAFLPGAPWLSLPAMLLLTAACVAGYDHTRGARPGGRIVLYAAAAVICCGIIANVHYFTVVSGGTDAAPVLHNWDSAQYWRKAMWTLDYLRGQIPAGQTYADTHGALGTILGAVMNLTGPSITVALLFNLPLVLGALIAVSSLTRRVMTTAGNPAGTLAADDAGNCTGVLAMACTACVCYLMAEGTVLLKEFCVIFGVAVYTMGLMRTDRRRRGWLFAGIIIVWLFRPHYCLLLAGGAFAGMLINRKLRLSQVLAAVAVAAVCVALVLFADSLRAAPDLAARARGGISTTAYMQPEHYAFLSVLGDLNDLSWLQKLLLVPFSFVLQYLLPFPWGYSRHLIFGYTQAAAHFAYPWYLFGALALYFWFAPRRRAPRALKVLSLWALLLYAGTAMPYCGAVSRYGLCAVPLFAPSVAFVVVDALGRDPDTGRCRRLRPLLIYLAVFAAILAAGLIFCYCFQTLRAQGPAPIH